MVGMCLSCMSMSGMCIWTVMCCMWYPRISSIAAITWIQIGNLSRRERMNFIAFLKKWFGFFYIELVRWQKLEISALLNFSSFCWRKGRFFFTWELESFHFVQYGMRTINEIISIVHSGDKKHNRQIRNFIVLPSAKKETFVREHIFEVLTWWWVGAGTGGT